MTSSALWDNYLMDWITEKYPDRETHILDVGAGHGKYGRLLSGRLYKSIDGVEIWPAHAEMLRKSSSYSKIYEEDVRTLEFKGYYDVILMGDILEHMTVEDGQKLLSKLQKICKEIIVIVPYEYPQHELYGNKFEIHLQPDLTLTNVPERYPQLYVLFSMVYKNGPFKGIGVFVSNKPEKSDVKIVTN